MTVYCSCLPLTSEGFSLRSFECCRKEEIETTLEMALLDR